MIRRYANPEVDTLSSDESKLKRWQTVELTMLQAFADEGNLAFWNEVFAPEYLLRNEAVIYRELLGD